MNQKIHRPILQGICFILDSCFNQKRYADKCIEYAFKKNKKWGSRDRKLIAETVYEVVRNWRMLAVISDIDFQKPSYTEGDFFKIIETWFSLEEGDSALLKKVELLRQRSERESVQDWFDEVGERNYGKDWPAVLHSLNEESTVYLRVNAIKASEPNLVVSSLAEESIVAKRTSRENWALALEERKNVFTSKAFKGGLFEVQDLGSQMISIFVAPEPGERIIDACAGAGGKSLHLAAIMKNKGKIIALDIYQSKLDELRRRSTRAGVDIIETKLIDDSKVIKRLQQTCDRLLLDVPCSGSGIMRRNPDSKWKWTKEEFENVQALQTKILVDYTRMVKKNGFLIYSTCSIFKEENEKQIEAFLKCEAGKGWELIQQKNLSPIGCVTDGFFMAKLQLKNVSSN